MNQEHPVPGSIAPAVGAAPLIGIGGIPMQCRYGDHGVWDEPVVMLQRAYVDAVARGGGIALVIPPAATVAADPGRVLEALDGLVLAGGGDIDPALYGAECAPETRRVDVERDASELALARAALEHDLPLLGICRGMELLNVARGGTLTQHLPARLGHDRHLRSVGTFEQHAVALQEGSAAARLAGGSVCAVRSHHHQAVDRLGEGVVATGWDEHDAELVEAIELDGAALAVGVQWHPEEDPASPVIPAFVAEVARRRLP